MNKTALATSTGLAYDKLVKYLAWMSEKGFVEVDENGAVVLTKAGSEAYDDFVQWIMKYVGQLNFRGYAYEHNSEFVCYITPSDEFLLS